MYARVSTNIETQVGIIESFLFKIGLHQGSKLSPFIFTVIMEEISKSICKIIPWFMLFVDDIVLVEKLRRRSI